MKKIVIAVLMVIFGLFGCYNIEQNNKNYNPIPPICPCPDCPADAISVTQASDSPSGEIPPGDDRLLAIFTLKTDEAQELYGLELEVVDNYPDYWFVDEIWIEDGSGNLVSPRQSVYDVFTFWGIYDLPTGETRIKVMGHIAFGEEPDTSWNPRPEIRVKVNGVYASTDVEYAHDLQGNQLIPKYSGDTYVSAGLSANAPSGQVFEGMIYEVYRFDLWTDQGTSYFSHPVFEYNQDFDGDLLNCSLWQGGTLLSDKSTSFEWENSNGLSIWFNPEDEKPLLTSQFKTFSLWCQVETNSNNQNLQIRLLGGQYETGIEGNSIYIPPPADWNSWNFLVMDQLYVSLDVGNPQVIVPGVNVTLMKFKMVTSAKEAKLYSVPFVFFNRPAGVYSNCHIEDENNNTLNVDISGHDLGNNNIYEIYFFGPSTGGYPGDAYNFTVIGNTWRSFKLVCDVAPASGTATTIGLKDVYYYQVGTSYFDVKPDTTPMIETWVIQP